MDEVLARKIKKIVPEPYFVVYPVETTFTVEILVQNRQTGGFKLYTLDKENGSHVFMRDELDLTQTLTMLMEAAFGEPEEDEYNEEC